MDIFAILILIVPLSIALAMFELAYKHVEPEHQSGKLWIILLGLFGTKYLTATGRIYVLIGVVSMIAGWLGLVLYISSRGG